MPQYSKEHKATGYPHANGSVVVRMTEKHFTRRIPPTGRKSEPTEWCFMCNKHGKRLKNSVSLLKL
jgi:hypothetical protein